MEEIMNKIEKFWQEFLTASKLAENTKYSESFHFDLSERVANHLLSLVLKGIKTATASSLLYYENTGEKIPKVGDYSIVTDWEGDPHCVIKTTKISILPFNEITYDICKREGEDDTLQSWRDSHQRFFSKQGESMGFEFSEAMEVVFEDFEVVYRS